MIELLGRAMLALGLVLTVMWLLARWARRPMSGKSERVLTVLARQQLGKGSSVAVIKVGDRALVVGVTDSSVQLLTETDLDLVQQSLVSDELVPRRRRKSNNVDTESQLSDSLFDEPAAGVLVGARTTGSASHKAQPLDGSVLSPAVWKQLVGSVRELTVRR